MGRTTRPPHRRPLFHLGSYRCAPTLPLLLSSTLASADQAPERGLKLSLRSKQPSLVLTALFVFNSHSAVVADGGFLQRRKETV